MLEWLARQILTTPKETLSVGDTTTYMGHAVCVHSLYVPGEPGMIYVKKSDGKIMSVQRDCITEWRKKRNTSR